MPKARKFKQRGGSVPTAGQRGGSLFSEQPGSLHLSQTSLVLILAVSLVICGAFIYFALQNRSDINIKLEVPSSQGAPVPQMVRNPVSVSNGVPAPPERHYQTGPDFNVAGNIFNVPTQGYAESYQQVGLLVAPGGSALSGNGERTLVPLYGRRTMASRNKWNYYMRTDGLNPVQVPVRYKNRDCDDDNGCDEIYQGDEVSAPAQGQTYKANIYRQKSQVYNPFSV